eukprot:TRINITY_DN5813_c0_g3_i1.p1 TRINITY_DN5813_c0_g3~~TRINITY_DN5813_c0_g3_i1.p1  ORF type:complete len:869 (+),score=46.37 TRINITY_DN5813_c0_g3_i1:200-2806(+)
MARRCQRSEHGICFLLCLQLGLLAPAIDSEIEESTLGCCFHMMLRNGSATRLLVRRPACRRVDCAANSGVRDRRLARGWRPGRCPGNVAEAWPWLLATASRGRSRRSDGEPALLRREAAKPAAALPAANVSRPKRHFSVGQHGSALLAVAGRRGVAGRSKGDMRIVRRHGSVGGSNDVSVDAVRTDDTGQSLLVSRRSPDSQPASSGEPQTESQRINALHSASKVDRRPLHVADIVIISLFCTILISMIVYVRFFNTGDLAPRQRGMPWYYIGLSLFMSNLGTDNLIGLAGVGAVHGYAAGTIEWASTYSFVFLAWRFIPHYFKHEIHTMPDYIKVRFGHGAERIFTFVELGMTIFERMAIGVYAAALVVSEFTHCNMYSSALLCVIAAVAYSFLGGQRVVNFASALQAVMMLVGCMVILTFALANVGMQGMEKQSSYYHLSLTKPWDHPDFPWPALFLVWPVGGIWTVCTDQVSVQPVLMAESVKDAKRACLLAGWLKLLPMYIMVLPGMLSYALTPVASERTPNRSIFYLMHAILPSGYYGFVFCMLVSGFLTNLATCLRAVENIFVHNVWKAWKPNSSHSGTQRASLIFNAFVVALVVLWIPVISYDTKELYIYKQNVEGIVNAPICVIFLATLFSDKVSGVSAIATLVFGCLFGFAYFIVHDMVPRNEHVRWLDAVQSFPPPYMVAVNFALSSAVMALTHSVAGRAEGDEETVDTPELASASSSEPYDTSVQAGSGRVSTRSDRRVFLTDDEVDMAQSRLETIHEKGSKSSVVDDNTSDVDGISSSRSSGHYLGGSNTRKSVRDRMTDMVLARVPTRGANRKSDLITDVVRRLPLEVQEKGGVCENIAAGALLIVFLYLSWVHV